MFEVFFERSVRPDTSVLSLPELINRTVRLELVEGQSLTVPNEVKLPHGISCAKERTVRPELVEGQSPTFANEAIMPNEGDGYMLRQAQHERFPGWLSLVKLAVANTASLNAGAA